MSFDCGSDHLVYAPRLLQDDLSWQGALQHEVEPFASLFLQRGFVYPTPPMSGPPSPSRTQPPELSTGAERTAPVVVTTSGRPAAAFLPALATPTTSSARSSGIFGQSYGPERFTLPPTTALLQPGRNDPSSAQASRDTLSVVPSASDPSTSSRGGRRSKTHVASACINCKRAHLSCDVQRPCARCVASGKQETCVDVQHKRRGRPRLREEGEFRVEQMVPEPAPQAQAPRGPPQTQAQPAAGTRQRRAESFRSLRSQTSEDSPRFSASTPSYAPSTFLQSPFSTQPHSTLSSDRAGYEIATALLDLDFVVLRANGPFAIIMMGGQDLRGRQIADIAAPTDNESFQSIRNRLRAERESREPAYMPPILQLGQDPVQGIPEADVDQFTLGYSDHTYHWTHTQLGDAAQRFPVRVRLAKASTYFVVVTLPSYRPVQPPPAPIPASPYSRSLVLGPPLQGAERSVASRQFGSYQSSQPAYFPFQHATSPISQPQPPPSQGVYQFASLQTYPPPPPMMPQQQLTYPTFHPATPANPRPPRTDPATRYTGFAPRATPRMYAPSVGAAELQLAPIVGAAGSQSTGETVQPGSFTEEEQAEEAARRLRSPRKKRRMGIDDVLQR